MALSDLFTIKSKKQSEQDAQLYEKKIFPFGEEQKKRVQQHLNDTVPADRVTDREVFYQYIVCRQLLADGQLEEKYGHWYHAGIGRLLTHQQKAAIRAYAMLDAGLTDANQQIDPAQLAELICQLESEEAPEKPRRKLWRL